MRTLLAAGNVQLLTSSDRETLPPLFELYRGIEANSWKARTDVAFDGSNKLIEYYTELMEADQPMQITLQVLLLDGVPIAGLMTGAFAKGLYALHIVYDDRYAGLAPGSAILWMAMRLAIEDRYGFFNLLQGFGYYKSRWLAQMTRTQSLQIYRIGSPFYWRRVLGDAKRRWFSAAPVDKARLANPARRAIARTGATHAIQSRSSIAHSEERARYAALIARVKGGRGEFLSSEQLVAILPFASKAAPEAPTITPTTPKARASSRSPVGFYPSGTTTAVPATTPE
jgi:hypothetical protein